MTISLYKANFKSNLFKALLLLIFLAFTLVEIQCASKASELGESGSGEGNKGEVPIARVHGGHPIITFSRKRPPPGQYVVGIIRGIPVVGVTLTPITHQQETLEELLQEVQ